jgi:peptidoglycan-associated lipoprotein
MRTRNLLIAVGVTVTGLVGACSHEKAAVVTPPPQAAAPAAPQSAPPELAPAPQPKMAANAVYFDFDASSIRDDSRVELQRVAEELRKNPNAKVRIEGNCDERGTTEYNLALGSERAEAAKMYLQHLGVESARIETASYGSERPKYVGHDEDAWSKNRRDDLFLGGGKKPDSAR